MMRRNLDQLETVIADKGYDWDDLPQKLRDNGLRPVIKNKDFYHLDKVHKARMNDEMYHRRSNFKLVFSAIKHRYGD